MLYIVTNVFDPSQTTEDIDSIGYDQILPVILDFLQLDSINQVPKIPSKRPYRKLLEAQKKVPYVEEFFEPITDICMDLYNTKGERYLDLIYQVLLQYPFAHTAMTVFLHIPDINDQLDLLQAINYAFEVTHKQALLNPEQFQYEVQDNREYLLGLESLAYIYKRQGKTKNALELYRKILHYDEDDHLHVKRAMLMPLLSIGMIDEFMMIRETLPEDSIYKLYLNLYDRLVGMEPFHQDYIAALQQSPIIMDLICSNEEYYGEATEEEKRFIEDFIPVFRHQPKYLKQLKQLHLSSN